MKKIQLLFLLSIMVFFTACGTEIRDNPTRFDMWDYMTSSIDYEVEYDIYENGLRVDYYVENHRMYNDYYERESFNGITTLYPNGNNILMREPSQDVTIERYLNLGDRGIFHAPSIQICSLTRFYDRYERRGSVFNNVIMVSCIMNNGTIQEYYYGYNEGIIAIYEDDGFKKTEWIKVRESRI